MINEIIAKKYPYSTILHVALGVAICKMLFDFQGHVIATIVSVYLYLFLIYYMLTSVLWINEGNKLLAHKGNHPPLIGASLKLHFANIVLVSAFVVWCVQNIKHEFTLFSMTEHEVPWQLLSTSCLFVLVRLVTFNDAKYAKNRIKTIIKLQNILSYLWKETTEYFPISYVGEKEIYSANLLQMYNENSALDFYKNVINATFSHLEKRGIKLNRSSVEISAESFWKVAKLTHGNNSYKFAKDIKHGKPALAKNQLGIIFSQKKNPEKTALVNKEIKRLENK